MDEGGRAAGEEEEVEGGGTQQLRQRDGWMDVDVEREEEGRERSE